MRVSIFQINLDRDLNKLCFKDYSENQKVDKRIYDEVWSGEIRGVRGMCDLEKIYEVFNIAFPEGYTGRSLSVSDVVGLDSGEKEFYYVDSIGFKKIIF